MDINQVKVKLIYCIVNLFNYMVNITHTKSNLSKKKKNADLCTYLYSF